jgi:hypothetical protein
MAQHLQALRQANEVRAKRYALKREIKARKVSVADLLREEIPPWLERMPLEEIVLSLPRFERRRFEGLMGEAGAAVNRQVGEMTRRQRYLVAEGVEKWEAARPTVREVPV